MIIMYRCVNSRMEILCDLYLAYLGKRNIFQEVKEFRKHDSNSQNF